MIESKYPIMLADQIQNHFDALKSEHCVYGNSSRQPDICFELLEILVLEPLDEHSQEPSGIWLSHRLPEPDGHEIFLDWRFAWHYRIYSWIDHLGTAQSRASDKVHPTSPLSSFFVAQTPAMTREQRARAARILAVCEALLFSDPQAPGDDGNSWLSNYRQSFLPLTTDQLLEHDEFCLGEILGTLSQEAIPFSEDWKIPYAALIAIAVAFSQSRLNVPIVWEAFSAAYVDHQLRQHWHRPLQQDAWRPIMDGAINFITYLIRHQYSLTLFLQGRGNNAFLDHIDTIGPAFDESLVLKSLIAFSYIVAYRNRGVSVPSDKVLDSVGIGNLDLGRDGVDPGLPPVPHIHAVQVRSDYSTEHNPRRVLADKCQLSELVDILSTQGVLLKAPKEQHCNWTIHRPLDGVSDRAFYAFSDFVEKKMKSSEKTPTLFTLDRHLLTEIPGVFAYCINAVAFQTDPGMMDKVFCGLFEARAISIPPFSSSNAKLTHESAVEVLLRPRIAAYALLFPPKAVAEEESAPPTWKILVDDRVKMAESETDDDYAIDARALLEELYAKGSDYFQLDADALEDGRTYVPFPFVRRLLDVVSRLKRRDCVSVNVRFDEEEPEYVYFPASINPHSPIGGIISKYIHALILNRAMTTGYSHCDLSDVGLDSYVPVSDEHSILAASAGAGKDQAHSREDDQREENFNAWKERIRAAYEENVYWVYSEKYVRDYREWRKAVELSDSDITEYPRTSIRDTIDRFVMFANSPAWESSPYLFGAPMVCGQSTSGKAGSDSRAPYQEISRVSRSFDFLLLGIDIGGTLVKLQFYEYSPSKNGSHVILPCTEPLRITTPVPRSADLTTAAGFQLSRQERSQRLRNIADVFASDLVSAIVKVVQNDRNLYTKFQGGGHIDEGGAILGCVGVAWPGGVRASRIVGTSGILKDFPPLTRNIDDNRIEDLLDLDICGALKKAFTREPLFSGLVSRTSSETKRIVKYFGAPKVTMVNDGIAEGYGTTGVLPPFNSSSGTVVFAKIGTGLATSAFREGRPAVGIWEGGKIALDLGSLPNGRWLQGDASSSVSKRFMPAFAQKELLRLSAIEKGDSEGDVIRKFNLNNLDSQELGGFFGKLTRQRMEQIRVEFGLRDLASYYENIDVQILRRVYDQRIKAELEWQNAVARIIGTSGSEGIRKFRNRVNEAGYIRMSTILGVTSQCLQDLDEEWESVDLRYGGESGISLEDRDSLQFFQGTDEVKKAARAIQVFRRRIAEPSADALGRRLADLIVTLWDIGHFQELHLTGGVLAGETRNQIVESVRKRVADYNLLLHFSGSRFRISKNDGSAAKMESEISDSTESASQEGEAHFALEHGAFGAAMVSLGAFLYAHQHRGLDRIFAEIRSLGPNGTVVVQRATEYQSESVNVFQQNERSRPTCISWYTLTADELLQEIDANSSELHVYLSGIDHQGRVSYVRWPHS